MRYRRTRLFCLVLIVCLTAFILDSKLQPSYGSDSVNSLLAPAPTQPLGSYDYFGEVLSPQEAAQLVRQKGLNPLNPNSYLKIGAVQVTQDLIDDGEEIFFERDLGDRFGLQRVLGFSRGFIRILPEVNQAIEELRGKSTSNLQIRLQKPLKLGSRFFPKGSIVNTGLDVEAGGNFPIGVNLSGGITCAACHVTLSKEGDRLDGVPNGDLNIPFLIALAPNSAAGFARLEIDPLDPQYQGNGKKIIGQNGQIVELPDPEKFEAAFDDLLFEVPFGHFESSPDAINNTTQIPSVFTFNSGPYTAGGEFAVGPFAGLTALNNAVHSSEINLLAAAQLSEETLDLDPEVYTGVLLQEAADPSLRLPDTAVKPSDWLRQVAPDPNRAELADQIPAPGAGTYPKLKPSLFTYNGLIFSPKTFLRPRDEASGRFLFADNAMSAWQNSLLPPPNRTPENRAALENGSVRNGARIFQQANCASCHIPPFFTDNQIYPVAEIKTSSARGESRLGLNPLLVPPKIYSLDTIVPPPAQATVLDLPTQGISATPTTLPNGVLPDGGYKTTSLRGLYLSAPYLHDGGVAVREGALRVSGNGQFQVVDGDGLGLPATLSQGKPADAASSLRALLDRDLRAQVIAANQASPALVRNNLDGTGHPFYVDRQAGFSAQQQADLVNFLLALDDDPGRFDSGNVDTGDNQTGDGEFDIFNTPGNIIDLPGER